MADDRNWFQMMWDYVAKAKCPKCNKSGGRTTRKHIISTTDEPKTKQQAESHYDSKGHYAGTTYRSVQVIERTQVYDEYYLCDYCQHDWHARKTYTFQP